MNERSQELRQYLFGEEHEALMTERRAHQVLEPDGLAELADLVEHALRCSPDDHVVHVALDGIAGDAMVGGRLTPCALARIGVGPDGPLSTRPRHILGFLL